MDMPATEAKREFGELILKAQSEPVRILRNGKHVAAVISDKEFQQYAAFKRQQLKQALEAGMDDLHAGRVADGEGVFSAIRKEID
ncbi:antitoxin of toxin-antitoxin system Phd [Alcanivorax hongdengensis A-11-3]|uniref:Antitoxin of toxin-antitoxin system Phd n=1 Tax=Alcanivorax hongdengensis A-11-3 TaxID=1177179 RepID=L0W8V3_9GAMM|nr:type II toxin-antitoxin system prevent-host-death family antitoxin [Alcanivorax hongdengensis]EKF73163.1 antitoxin of toxin-antitoxin system Phd [Alcanivorax hongdengensis A-11-3]